MYGSDISPGDIFTIDQPRSEVPLACLSQQYLFKGVLCPGIVAVALIMPRDWSTVSERYHSKYGRH
jgi:hypothetical protein